MAHLMTKFNFSVDLYQGKDNPISVSRLYSITFVCSFDLALYPFDVQNCDMKMRITSATTDYLKFNYLNSTIHYVGSKFLVEYEVPTWKERDCLNIGNI